ncbi:DUF6059 family protein [Streptomyces bluensis]|uniref:DUF6059 family protein n=1 Tax=Streptomyces bluensis TaxID=33897 RepID=UPI0019AED1FF|nr:DUF6059 family protein [Streptomyces bluensis]GGZ73220.1 hypothetical protein GCM10010344_45140 [Streptomyces bluensis]
MVMRPGMRGPGMRWPGMWWWTVRRAAWRVWRGTATFLADGFGALAVMFGMVPPVSVDQAKQWWLGDGDPRALGGIRPLDAPPRAHPERLVADTPLSPGERELWAQLEGRPGRVGKEPGRRE